MTQALLVLALVAQAPFAVDTLRLERGPELLWHRLASPLVALRLSAPVDADIPAGAAELLQELARPAAAAQARRFGAQLQFRVEGDEAVLSVTGPATAFDALVGILRHAMAEPDVPVTALRSARARAEDRVLASLERPVPRLRALLRASLTGARAAGPALDRLTPERIRALASRLHDPTRLRVVLVGDLPPEIVRSAFGRWPRHVTFETAATPDSAPPLPQPQAHHAWAALAYPLDDDPAAAAIAAALIQSRIRAAGLREGMAEAWALDGRSVLVVLGGAAPDDADVAGAASITAFPTGADEDEVSALARFLRRMVAEAAALVSPSGVADAASAIRRGILLDSRTAAGRAEVLGRWSGPREASRLSVHEVLASLERASFEEVRAALIAVLATPAVLAEVRP